MIALVTGGAGFIGSHLAERLVADDHEVWVIDDLSTGSMENIAPLIESARFHYRIAHLSYQEAYAEGFEDLGRRIPDLHKLERAIGFRPSASIGTIIRRIIDHERGRC